MTVHVDEKNKQAMIFVDSTLGLLSTNIRCAAFGMQEEGRSKVYFVLRQESAKDREAIRLIVDEFWALQDSSMAIGCEVVVSDGPIILPLPEGLLPTYMEYTDEWQKP
ncbi:MAG: hypothetical protein V4532_09730 [Pseudomonadota bacterium]